MDDTQAAELAELRIQLGGLIARAPHITSSHKPNTQRASWSAIERGRVRNRRELYLTSACSFNSGSARDQRLLTIESLMRLSTTANIALAGVFCADLWAVDVFSDAELIAIAAPQKRRRNREHDWPAICARVSEAIEKRQYLLIADLARELEVKPSALLVRLGGLGHELSKQNRLQALERKDREIEAYVSRICALKVEFARLGKRLTREACAQAFGVRKSTPRLVAALRRVKSHGV